MIALALVISLIGSSVSAALSCKNENGKKVDWFIVLKHNSGFDYSYLDSDSIKFTDGVTTLDVEDDGAVALTLGDLYSLGLKSSQNETQLNATSSKSKSHAYAYYNDEKPNGDKSTNYAHAKGVLAFDSTSGFWLLHSIPKWPQLPRYKYHGPPDDKYGQSMICITMETKEFNKLAHQLQIMTPWIYADNLPKSLENKVPDFADWLDGAKKVDSKADIEFSSSAGQNFKHFAKDKKIDIDLWAEQVAPGLKSDLWVESWQNGIGDLGPFCKGDGYDYSVTDIQELKVGKDDWDVNQDHSKWGISTDKNWVCIGDINRQSGQRKRGGGTICIDSSDVHSEFSRLIKDHDKC